MKGELDNGYSKSALEGGLAGGIQGLGIAQGLGKSPWDFTDATQAAPATNGLSLGANEQIADIGQKYGQPQGLKPNLFNSGGLSLGMNSFKKFSPY